MDESGRVSQSGSSVPSSRSKPNIITIGQFNLGASANLSSLASTINKGSAEIRRNDDQRKRICLFGIFGLGNFGNDGSLEAMLIILRQALPEAELSCICVNPDKIQRDYKISTIPISWPGFSSPALKLFDKVALKIPGKLANWVRAIRYVSQFDAMIIPGTSILSDYRADPFGPPYGLFRWSTAAKISSTKVYFVCVGAATMHRRVSRWMLTYVAKTAYYRSFRDKKSKDFISTLGVDTERDQIYHDLAFRLPTVTPEFIRSGAHPVTVGVGVMDYNGWHGQASKDDGIYTSYLSNITRFIRNLLERGYRVRLFIGELADQKAVADVQESLRGRIHRSGGCEMSALELSRLVAEPVESLHSLMCQMGDVDVVVASRFHNLVCAMKMVLPAISIGYETKNDALMLEMGLGKFCHHIERFDAKILMQQVTEVLTNKSYYTGIIRQKLAEIERHLAQQERLLVQLL